MQIFSKNPTDSEVDTDVIHTYRLDIINRDSWRKISLCAAVGA